MPTLEQSLVTLQQQNASLVNASDQLTSEVATKIQSIDARVAAKEQEVDSFLQTATPETRYVQDIIIGGSPDFLYPVWWRFPGNNNGVSKITIARNYSWNGDVGERPLNSESNHQAALLLEMEGNDAAWGGDSLFMDIKRYHYNYNPTASHASFKMYSHAEPIEGGAPLYSSIPNDGAFGDHCHNSSGLYLRGGGLRYLIIKNWTGDIHYHDGSDMLRRVINEFNDPAFSVRWFAEPIPFSSLQQPIQTVDAVVTP